MDAIVIDPESPILSAAGLDENTTVGVRQLLDSFDALAKLGRGARVDRSRSITPVGLRLVVLARGASAFGDWPGAEWNLQMSNSQDPFLGS